MIIRITVMLIALVFSTAAYANYVGSEVQYFNPTPDNMDFITVQSSRSLPKGTLKTTLFFDYAENIHYSDIFENNVMQSHLGFGVGVTDRFSFSVVGSGIVDYSDDEGGAYTDENFTHLRSSFKYSFCNCPNGGFALVANIGLGLMNPDYFVGDENDFGASLLLVYDFMLSERIRVGTNLGYRYRNSNDNLPAAPSLSYAALTNTSRDGSDVLASLGMNFLINRNLTAVSEIYFSLPTDKFFDFTTELDNYEQNGGEFLLGANYSLNNHMDFSFGGTLGVMENAANADWRVFLGFGYFFGANSKNAAFSMTGKDAASTPIPTPVKEDKTDEVVSVEDAPVLKAFNITAQFPSGSANLTNQAKLQIKTAGDFIKANPTNIRAVFIEGHSDSRGDDNFNRMLSERRAQMVKNWLIRAYGIKPDRVKAIGYGESVPLVTNSTPEGRAKNRRVVIKIK